MNIDNLEKSIIETICWFDLFSYPLTPEEIYRWNYFQTTERKINLFEIKNILKTSDYFKKTLSQSQGFYFLKGSQNLDRIRKERYLIAEEKTKKFLKIAKFLALVPFLRAMIISNGLSYSNSQEQDDIDLLIITEKKRTWLVRFFLILILKFFHARPTPKNKKNKICLNFFISTDSLNLEKLMIRQKGISSDIYFIYWLSWLYPIYKEGSVWQKFVLENYWIKNFLPNWFFQEAIWRRQVITKKPFLKIKKYLEIINDKIFKDLLESFFCWCQKKILPRHLKEMANKDSRVIINNHILKFHDKDKREKYREKFINKISRINL